MTPALTAVASRRSLGGREAAPDQADGAGSIFPAFPSRGVDGRHFAVLARLQGMDGTLEEAAMILGAEEVTTFRKVTVPRLWPGILAGV